MQFDIGQLDADACARLITATVVPRPIAWVTTLSAGGVRNAVPFSFFNALCSWPPILGLGMQPREDGTPKDTLANIAETGTFVVNLVAYPHAEAMNATGAPLAPAQDEIAAAGLATVASSRIAPPRLACAPVAFECRSRQIIEIAAGRVIVFGEVLVAHVEDGAVTDRGRCLIDTPSLSLIGRMHGRDRYLRARDLFTLARR